MANELAIYNDPNGVTRVVVPAPIALRLQTLKEFQITLQEMQNEEKELKEMFGEVMDKYGVTSIEVDDVTITRRKPSTRTSIDSKRLKADRPDIFEEYSKVSNVAGSTLFDYGD